MLKIYDSSLGRYVTIASNRGDKLYTKSINFQSPELPNYDNDSSIITIDEALTSISDEIKNVKEGVAWVYKNGTLGGGGGSGAGVPKFKVTTSDGNISNNSIIVNDNQTLNLTFSITGSTSGRRMTITIKDNKGNFYNYNNSTYLVSTKGTTIQIPNIKDDMYIEFSGYDQETLSIIEPYVLNIKVSELKITGPDAVEISKSDTSYELTYDVKTTAGQNTWVVLTTKIAGHKDDYTYKSELFTNSRKITVDLFDVFPDLDLVELLRNNSINNMEINAQAFAGDYSSSTSTSIVFTSETEISIDIIPFSSVTGDAPSYEYLENDNMSFNIKMYFNTAEFYAYYELYQNDTNGNKIVVYSKGDLNNPTSDSNKLTSTSYYGKNNPITIPYPSTINVNNGPVYIYVKAWDKMNIAMTGERTKWCKIKSDANWAPYNLSLSGKDVHIDGGLNYLYYEFNTKDIANVNISDIWTTSRIYRGSNLKDSTVTGSIKYFNANNINNGLILRGGLENTNTLRMASNTYATLLDDAGNPVRPFTNNNSNWFNNKEGWTISLSFKSDIQPKTDSVIFSCASFTNRGEFDEGIYITTEDINVRFSNANGSVDKWNLSAKITQNVINHVDIVYKPKTFDNGAKIGELLIYINGVLSAAGVEKYIDFEEYNHYPTISNDIIFGATQNKNVISNYSDVNFYRILFYKRYLSAYHATKNMIQGDAEIKLLDNGNIDKLTNTLLRAKNFFNEDGTCALINGDTYDGECKFVNDLYTAISANGKNPLPIVYIKVDDVNFKGVSENRYNEAAVAEDKKKPESEKIITKAYQADITIINEKSNRPFVMGSKSGEQSIVNDFTGGVCTVKLQGTSTLGNKSKNYEISFGADKEHEHLVQPFADMLPENSWILKADVMDSGHANNAAIGSFINDYMAKYPTTVQTDGNYPYASEIKATTKGHPVMLFMQFGDSGNKEFMGIYSFNLGRISHYNLGYQKFDGYYKVISERNGEEKLVEYENHAIKDTTIEFPAYVSNYKSIAIPHTSDLAGVSNEATTAVCFECTTNDNKVATFQQSDNNVINAFYNRVYPETVNANTEEAFRRFRKIFVATSNLYECDPEYLCKLADGDEYLKTRSLCRRNTEGKFFNTATNEYEEFNSANINLYELQDSWAPTDPYEALTSPQDNANDNNVGLDWEYLSAYFTLAMLFGLVDSLGKNLNIRSFNLTKWYTEFYDMDTGLALTNAGYETIKKDVYLDTFAISNDKQSASVKINGYNNGGYDTTNSRLFNIVRFFTTKAFPNTGSKPTINYRKIWEDIRKTVLRNPDEFLNNYYIKQNESVGEMLFNYDYDVKYINDEINLIENPNSNGKSSINFLHGNRINFVRDWFTKHVYFLDGVFDIKCQAPVTEETRELFGNAAGSGYYGIIADNGIIPDSAFTPNAENVICPYISFSDQNDRVNPAFDGYKPFKVRANMPLFFIYNNGIKNQRIYIPENAETEVQLYFKSGNGQTMSFNYEPYLITFDKFGVLSYDTMDTPNLASLNELDLSDMKTLSGAKFDISKLVELRKLNMNNTKTTSGSKLAVNLVDAKKISYIDLRNSDVNSLILPKINGKSGGVIEELYIDNTDITSVDLSDNTMLHAFSANGCDNLASAIFKNNTALTSFGRLPVDIKNLTIDGCNSLKEISLIGMNNLSNDTFNLGYNENVEKFNYMAGTKAENPIDILDLSGCPNIKEIHLQNFAGSFITLNIKSQKTLEYINLTNSNISYILWYDDINDYNVYTKINNSHEGILDFSKCENLTNIDIAGQETVKYLILPENRVFESDNFSIARCKKLERVIGSFNTNVNKFINLSSFRFNELCKADADDMTSFITLNADGTVEIADADKSKDVLQPDDNGNFYRLVELERSLTNYSFDEDGAKIEGSFSGTCINISDLYAILTKLKTWKSEAYITEDNPDGFITEFISTFKDCANIVTSNPNAQCKIEQQIIRLDIFTPFTNLLRLVSTFAGCKNISGLITSDHAAPNGFEKSIFDNDSLCEIDNVFNGCGELKISSFVFYHAPSLEKIYSPFSASTKHYNNINSNSIRFEYIFEKNTKLREIVRLFNGTQVKLQYNGSNISKLFANNPNVEVIQYLLSDNFQGLSPFGIFDINFADVFGGYSKFKGYNLNGANYPTHIKNLDHAFALDTIPDDIFTLNWNNMNYILYGQSCEYNNKTGRYENNTLETCAYMFNNLATLPATDKDGYVNYGPTIAKFPIDMFNIIHKDANNVEHEVWFTNLASCEGLFMRSAFKNELKFPGNIFKHCVANNLNLSHLLEDSVMTPIKLVTSDDVDENGNKYACFENCKLGDISSMFKNCFKEIKSNDLIDPSIYSEKLYKYDRGGLHGLIPYKFFKNAGKITNMNNLFEGCCHLGNDVNLVCDASGNYVNGNGKFTRRTLNNFYNVKRPSIDVVNDIILGNKSVSELLDLVEYDVNKRDYVWNAWSYDGTIFDDEYLNALNSIILDGLTYTEAKRLNIPNYVDIEWTKRDASNNVIIPDNNVHDVINSGYLKFKSVNEKLSLQRGSYDGEYLGIIDDGSGTQVPTYRIYYDADYDIKNVNYSDEHFKYQQLWNCDSATYLDNIGDYSTWNYKHNEDDNDKATPTLFISNYMMPMDIFRYCAPDCTVNEIFKNVSRFNNGDKQSKVNDYVYGLIGRIPPQLFKPLTELTELSGVFENCSGIIPYAQSLDGLLYNSIFDNNVNIGIISATFKGALILGSLSSRLFDNLTRIVNISEIFKNGYMPAEYASDNTKHTDYVNFIPNTLFKNNIILSNLSAAFARDNSNDELIKKSYLYFTLNTDLLTTDKHKNIQNVSGMFINQSNGIQRKNSDRSSFIDFRIWPYINNMSQCYSGANFDLTIIPEELGGTKK